MFRRLTPPLLVVSLIASACEKEAPPPKPAPAVALAPEPWFLASDAQCGFDSTANHPDPDALVREYVPRDGQGAFLRSDPWLTAAVECPGRERASSEYAIVASAQVVPSRTRGDSAKVGVRYLLLGVADPNGYRPDLRVVTETVAVNRTRFGWRIGSPAPMPHVLVDVARRRQTFTRADQWALDAAVTQAKRLSPQR